MIALSIDPGETTGWALIDYEKERITACGQVNIGHTDYLPRLARVMMGADLLIIEDQFYDEARRNPDSLIKLSAVRGAVEMLWAIVKGSRRWGDSTYRIKPSQWQVALGVSRRAKKKTLKRASIKMARLQTGTDGIPENAADAINQGLAIIRRIKAAKKTGGKNGRGGRNDSRRNPLSDLRRVDG